MQRPVVLCGTVWGGCDEPTTAIWQSLVNHTPLPQARESCGAKPPDSPCSTPRSAPPHASAGLSHAPLGSAWTAAPDETRSIRFLLGTRPCAHPAYPLPSHCVALAALALELALVLALAKPLRSPCVEINFNGTLVYEGTFGRLFFSCCVSSLFEVRSKNSHSHNLAHNALPRRKKVASSKLLYICNILLRQVRRRKCRLGSASKGWR